MAENCTTDIDCPGPLLCVVNASWNPPNTSVCDWYGWDDITTNCTTFSIPFYIQFGAELILEIGNGIAALILILDLIYQHRFTKIDFKTAVSTTTQFLILYFVLRTAYGAILLNDSLYPNGYILLGKVNKVSPTWIAEIILIITQNFFAVAALLNLSLQWIEVAERSKHLQSSKAKNVTRYKNVIRACLFIYLVVTFASFGTLNFGLAVICSFPIVLFILYTYTMGAKMLTAILEGAGANTSSEVIRKSTKNVVQRIRTTAKYLFILVLIALLLNIIEYLLTSSKKRAEWERNAWFRFDVFFEVFVDYMNLLILLVVGRYVHLSIRDHKKKPGEETVIPQESGVTTTHGTGNAVVIKVIADAKIRAQSNDEMSADMSKIRSQKISPPEGVDTSKIQPSENETSS